MAANTKPRKIIRRIVHLLQQKLNMNDTTCYAAIAPTYIPGMQDRVIQVIHGASVPEGGGHGAQDGGGTIIRRQRVRIVVWWRVLFDPHRASAELLTRESEGMQDFLEAVREPLSMTFLGENVLIEPLRNDGETEIQWHDRDKGIVRRDLTLSGPWQDDLPNRVTAVESDFNGV